jgi:hypothetical protein
MLKGKYEKDITKNTLCLAFYFVNDRNDVEGDLQIMKCNFQIL